MNWIKRLLYKINRLKQPVSVYIKTSEPSLNEIMLDGYVHDKRILKKFYKEFIKSREHKSNILNLERNVNMTIEKLKQIITQKLESAQHHYNHLKNKMVQSVVDKCTMEQLKGEMDAYMDVLSLIERK